MNNKQGWGNNLAVLFRSQGFGFVTFMPPVLNFSK